MDSTTMASQGPHRRSASQPLLALTMGDACGIGPEIIAKLFRGEDAAGCVVIGDIHVMRRAASVTGGLLPVAQVESAQDLVGIPPHCMAVLPVDGLPGDLLRARVGQVDARAGAAAAACIRQAVQLVQDGQVEGIVTAPIHKEALAAAGIGFPGHTEMLQSLAWPGQVPRPVRMMLANDQLSTVLVTIHMSLRDAIEAVTYESVLETIRIAHDAAVCTGLPRPRIGVAGLNPHAGEGGLFGDEEIRIIEPAVRAARALGIDAQGPFAPDTVFMRARNAPGHAGEFDIVIAMTHDHGLIPVKYLGVEEGVNVTLGLPFVRTSPDHGTAFDIAGQGVANEASLRSAVRMARRLVASAGTAGRDSTKA